MVDGLAIVRNEKRSAASPLLNQLHTKGVNVPSIAFYPSKHSRPLEVFEGRSISFCDGIWECTPRSKGFPNLCDGQEGHLTNMKADHDWRSEYLLCNYDELMDQEEVECKGMITLPPVPEDPGEPEFLAQLRTRDDIDFHVPSAEWQMKMSSLFHIPRSGTVDLSAWRTSKLITYFQPPKHVVDVLGDGNCFYRALSWSITGGDEGHHERIREQVRTFNLSMNQANSLWFFQVIAYRDANKELFESVLVTQEQRDEYEDARIPGRWATEIEISAAARLMKTTIYSYTNVRGRWSWMKHDVSLS